MPRTAIPSTRLRWRRLSGFVLGFSVLSVAAVVGVYQTAPSVLMKLRLAPRLERVVWSGSAVSGRVIDEGGDWFNDGKPTELVIRSEKTPDGWDRPEDIVIRNCRIRGSIRIVGLGVNGEAEGVRASSVELGHTKRAQAAAPFVVFLALLNQLSHHWRDEGKLSASICRHGWSLGSSPSSCRSRRASLPVCSPFLMAGDGASATCEWSHN